MPRNIRPSDSNRMQYGICLNDECPKCKTKEVQQVSMRRDFVCSECGKELRKCPPPKKGNKKILWTIIALLAVAAIVLLCTKLFSGSSDKKELAVASDTTTVDSTLIKEAADTPAKKDTVVVHDTIKDTRTKVIVKNAAPAPVPSPAPAQSNGTLRLSYGKYSGAIKDGYPHGQGRLTYTTTRQINRNDMKGRTADAGDYVIGEFYNGFVVYGKHYDSAGNLLESLNFGVGSESSYDSK
ncbi:MAG: hypothetical protein J6X27_01645 [Bacteroidaceae bacterium]|nr:hypothetical protein [Bacteroidaceae bacterium]